MYSAYVEFDKPIDDYSEASDYSFGMNCSPVAGGASRMAQRNGLQFTKDRDSLSAALFQHCAGGTTFGTVWLELYKDDNDYPTYTYAMSKVIISSIRTSGANEYVALDYGAMKTSYTR